MFQKETVFILGAGASVPYGYPTGQKLIEKIITSMDDEIYLPFVTKQQHGEIHSLEKYKINELPDDIKYEEAQPHGLNDSWSIGKRYFSKEKIQNIKEFKNLKSALEKRDPLSIDTFLRDNPSHETAGKTMIEYVLLGCEDKRKFSMTLDKNGARCNDNWYRLLLNDLLSGCEAPQSISKNRLSVVTFNYDLSLDFYLQDALSSIERYQENKTGENYYLDWIKNRFKHVYGSLYDPLKTENKYGKFFPENTGATIACDSKKFVFSVKNKLNIRLIQDRENPDQRKNENEIEELIKKAQEIIIIGFSFDRDNLDRLGLPNKLHNWMKLIGNKKILYLDFGGKMGGLNEQFNEIKSKFDYEKRFRRTLAKSGSETSRNIIRSTATKIEDAYQNDFKIFLY